MHVVNVQGTDFGKYLPASLAILAVASAMITDMPDMQDVARREPAAIDKLTPVSSLAQRTERLTGARNPRASEEKLTESRKQNARLPATAVFVCTGLMLASQTVLCYFSVLMTLMVVLEMLCSRHDSPVLLFLRKLVTWVLILLSFDLWLGSVSGYVLSLGPVDTEDAALGGAGAAF
jgi:hypothetical protein